MIATLDKYLAAKLLTEAFLKHVCLATAKHLASKSENELNDELVNALSDALKNFKMPLVSGILSQTTLS